MPGQSTKPKSLLILLPTNKTLALYFLSACEKLQQHIPELSIVWLTIDKLKPLISTKPNIDVITFDSSAISAIFSLRQKVLQYLAQHKATEFEQLIVAEQCKLLPFIIATLPAKTKSCFAQVNLLSRIAANQQIATPKRWHISDSAQAFLRSALYDLNGQSEVNTESETLHPFIDDQSQLWAAEQLSYFASPDKPIVVLQPFGLDKEHSWHGEGYAHIADHLFEKGFNVVITGTEHLQEKLLAEQIISLSTHKPLNLVGKTSIAEFFALQHIAEFVISADNWPLHSAALTHTPVVGLFYQRNPKIWAAKAYGSYVVSGYQDAVQKQYKKPVAKLPWGIAPKGKQLMRGISVSQVKDKIRQLLADLQ